MTRIEIPLSKKKMFLALIGSIIFIALGIAFMLNPEKYISFVFRNAELIRISGIAAFIFSTLCAIYISIKLFDNKPGLIIDQNGITDNSNMSSVGLIDWADITNINVGQVKSTKYLLIKNKNSQKYISRANKLNAMLLQANFKMYGTPISITSNSLKCDFEKLENLIRDKWNEYKMEKPNS
jgi:hypothetical protein